MIKNAQAKYIKKNNIKLIKLIIIILLLLQLLLLFKLALIKLFLLGAKKMFNTTTILSTLEMPLWQRFAMNGFSFAAGLGLYFILAAHYLSRIKRFRGDDKEEESSDEEDELSAEEEYKQLYYPELNELPDRELTADELETLSQHELFEHTPQGDVVLMYDAINKIYNYYTDHYQKLSYGTLDTVARKFAITFNCKTICVNAMQEYEKAKKEREVAVAAAKLAVTTAATAAATTTTATATAPKRIFAEFKVYNKVQSTMPTIPSKTITAKDEFFVEKINLFLYKGKMLDYEEKRRRSTNVVVDENLNYAMFKKLAALQAADAAADTAANAEITTIM